MMLASDCLKYEHEEIKKVLKIAGKLCEAIESGQKPELERLQLLLEYALFLEGKLHYIKEEQVLFPALEESGYKREDGPTAIMLQEHSLARGYIKGLLKSFAYLKKGDPAAGRRLAKIAKFCIGHMNHHIKREDGIIYKIADKLPEEKQKEMYGKFMEIENEIRKSGKYEEMERKMQELKKIYLPQNDIARPA